MAPSRILSLPAEFRNHVYEMVFHALTADPISLYRAAAPSGAPLLACQQMYNEASQMHKAACKNYWQTGRFFIDMYHFGQEERARLTSLRLPQIRHLELVLHAHWPSPPGSGVAHTYTMVKTLADRRGVWKRRLKLDGRPSFAPWYRGLIVAKDWVGEDVICSTEDFADVERAVAACELPGFRHPSVSAQVLHLLGADERLCREMGLRKVEYTGRRR